MDSIAAIAAATVTPQLAAGLLAAMAQEHERAAGAWHAEWILLPQLCSLSHQALLSILKVFQGLRVNAERMRENIEATLGLTAGGALANALAPSLGRDVCPLDRAKSCAYGRDGTTALAGRCCCNG